MNGQRGSWSLSFTVLALASACATTTQQVQANGQPLSADIREHTYEGYWLSDEWHPPHSEVNFDGLKQGDEEIDELDFYFIANDQPSIDKIVKSRDDENFAYRVLYGGGAVGGAITIAGFVVGGQKFIEGDDAFAESDQGSSPSASSAPASSSAWSRTSRCRRSC